MRRAIPGAVLLAGLTGLALAGCEPTYIYRPAVSTTAATVAGLPASYYEIPPEAPRGHVRIATMGLTEIQPQSNASEDSLHALHLRMVVANNSDRPWFVDTREQRAVLPRSGESRPAYAKVDQGTPPQVEIAPRTERTIDLFYPLPARLHDEASLPSFDALWQVDTDARRVVERTPFERIEVDPVAESYPAPYVWGGPYWYDPYYVHGGAFVGVGIAPVYVERPVVIRQYVHRAPPARRVR